ncbi:unnamed protein product, partial [Timema podura]|nr:unnamed protein product [Timema podura]
HCPSSLITPLTKIVLDEVKTACKKQPAKCGFQKLSNSYQPLKLMQVVTRKVNEVCLRYIDDGQVSTLPPPKLECPISACAVKNTRRRMEDRHVIIEDFHTLFNIQLYVGGITDTDRWLAVHICDMMTLAEKYLDALAEFKSENFVGHKTSNYLSVMALDPCHKHNNGLVKSSGRIIGLRSNPGAIGRWMVAGSEITRITTEFEEQGINQQDGACAGNTRHPYQKPKLQDDFLKDVKAPVTVLK